MAPWDDLPIALAGGVRLRAISSAAARARVRTGMTPAEARARCAALDVLPWDDVVIARVVTGITAQLLAASPQVTPVRDEPGLWWVGASGFDGVGGERGLTQALLAIARMHHPRARVAVADSCVAARAATWASKIGDRSGSVRIPPAGDADYLATAPLALIPMDDELRATLSALGLGVAGRLAALEAEDVERRWGAEGLAAWRLARGEDVRRPVLARPAPPRTVEAELPTPVTTTEPVLFLVRAALDQLAGALVADGRAAAAIAITLTLDDARGPLPTARPHTVTREVRFPRPVARVPQLLEHCRALLERFTPGAPVSAVAVSIVATAPAVGEQGDLLAQGWRDPAAVDAALARLRAELGPETVVRPVARDEHRPERAGAWTADAESGKREANAESGMRNAKERMQDAECGTACGVIPHSAFRIRSSSLTLLPSELAHTSTLRLLEVPEDVDIECADGVPAVVWWRERRWAIERARGPERLSGDWWKDSYDRDYWRCDGEGAELLLFQAAEGAWYVHGWSD